MTLALAISLAASDDVSEIAVKDTWCIQEDGVSYVLQEDGVSKIIFTTATD